MIDKKFIVNIQGKEFILFEGLLAQFHEGGGKTIETEEVVNSTATCPMFKATVSGAKGKFTGHGDADNTNVNGLIAKHKYRMAETRAIARALRWYNNIGMCSKDELGGDETTQPEPITMPGFQETLKDLSETTIVPASSPADKMKNYSKPAPANAQDDDKEWLTELTFADAIKKSVDAGLVKIGTGTQETMMLLRKKYKVANKWEPMINEEVLKHTQESTEINVADIPM